MSIRAIVVIVVVSVALAGSPVVYGAHGQQTGVAGGIRGGKPPAPAGPDLAFARTMSPDAFARSSVDVRRKVLRAWTVAGAERGGDDLLRMIEVALNDEDAEVRRYAPLLLRQVASHRLRTKATAAGAHPESALDGRLLQSMLAKLEHPDRNFRRDIVDVLLLWRVPPASHVERVLSDRLPREQDPTVRARIVSVLAVSARAGSKKSQDVVAAALMDAAPEVQLSAVTAVGRLNLVAAVPRLVQLLEAREPWLRRTTARVLAARFANAAVEFLPILERLAAAEPIPDVASELRRLVERVRAR